MGSASTGSRRFSGNGALTSRCPFPSEWGEIAERTLERFRHIDLEQLSPQSECPFISGSMTDTAAKKGEGTIHAVLARRNLTLAA